MHVVSTVTVENSFGNDQDRSGACDLASCAFGLRAVTGESCSFHVFFWLEARVVWSGGRNIFG